MKISHIRATSAHEPDGAEPPKMEAMWRAAKAALETAEENGLEGYVLDQVARRVEDVEERVAITPANSSDEVAAKLRIILTYEKDEAERRHWFPLLQSALADLERRSALVG